MAVMELDSDGVGALTNVDDVVLEFYATWCRPCKTMAPVLESLAEKGVVVAKVDVDKHPAVASAYGVISLPTTVRIKAGVETYRAIGAMPLGKLETALMLD